MGDEQNQSPNWIKLHVGDDEKLDSDPEEQDMGKEQQSPRKALSYRDAISKLRSRLGQSICPIPEPNVKKMAASALDNFKDSSEQNAEVYLALPQPNSVLGALNKMNKRLKGEEEIPMVPLPIYPKGFKLGSFAA